MPARRLASRSQRATGVTPLCAPIRQLWSLGTRDELRAQLIDAACASGAGASGASAAPARSNRTTAPSEGGRRRACKAWARGRRRAHEARPLVSDQDLSSIISALCREIDGLGCLARDGSITGGAGGSGGAVTAFFFGGDGGYGGLLGWWRGAGVARSFR